MKVLERILINILNSLYQVAIFSLIMSVLFMFVYILAKEHGWKQVAKKWITEYKADKCFRRVFCLAIYVAMILIRTLFNRGLWHHPLSNVIGVWGLYDTNGELTTEVIENLILFIPFTFLYLWVFREKLLDKQVRFLRVILQATRITFLGAFIIEFLQLLLRVGTFQLSDLFYNTLGGLIGGVIYYVLSRLRKNK